MPWVSKHRILPHFEIDYKQSLIFVLSKICIILLFGSPRVALRKEGRLLAVYHVNVMHGLFLFFDAQIFLMVNLSWESLVTGTIPISLGKRVICTLEEGITYCFPEKLTCFQNEKAISKKLVTKQKYCEYIAQKRH